jgi:sigma-B regulation protein RsbU (phosphoserine phosphatase)
MVGELNFSGLPLGMFHETEFSISKIKLNRGDSLLLFTDGVTECANADGTELGTCTIFEALGGTKWDEPTAMIGKCLEVVDGHRGTAGRNDDLTMLALTFA